MSEQNIVHFLTKRFPDERSAVQFLEDRRWKGKPACPYCDGQKVNRVSTGQPYKCQPCNRRFSVTSGTFMHGSKASARQWLLVLFFLSSRSKGMSSIELGKIIGVQQKMAWYMAQRVRDALSADSGLSGIVEMDETIVGKKNKTTVIGMKERSSGRVIAHKAHADKTTAFHLIKENVGRGAELHTDGSSIYRGIDKHGYKHKSVNHSKKEYSRGNVATNGIEGFWSRLKKGVHGTHHHVSKNCLQRYVDEFAFRETNKDFIEGVCRSLA